MADMGDMSPLRDAGQLWDNIRPSSYFGSAGDSGSGSGSGSSYGSASASESGSESASASASGHSASGEHKVMRKVMRLCAQSDNPADVWLNMRRILKKLNDAGAGIKPRPGERFNKKTLCDALAKHLGILPRDLIVAMTMPNDIMEDPDEWDSKFWDPVSMSVITDPYVADTRDGNSYLFDQNMLQHVQEQLLTHDRRPVLRGSIRKAPYVRDLLNMYALERYGVPLSDPSASAVPLRAAVSEAAAPSGGSDQSRDQLRRAEPAAVSEAAGSNERSLAGVGPGYWRTNAQHHASNPPRRSVEDDVSAEWNRAEFLNEIAALNAVGRRVEPGAVPRHIGGNSYTVPGSWVDRDGNIVHANLVIEMGTR